MLFYKTIGGKSFLIKSELLNRESGRERDISIADSIFRFFENPAYIIVFFPRIISIRRANYIHAFAAHCYTISLVLHRTRDIASESFLKCTGGCSWGEGVDFASDSVLVTQSKVPRGNAHIVMGGRKKI